MRNNTDVICASRLRIHKKTFAFEQAQVKHMRMSCTIGRKRNSQLSRHDI